MGERGALVGVAGGTAAVGFLFLFLRDAFGAPAAWIGAGLFAVHSRAVEYSSDVQSDGLYLGLFLAGVWFGWRAWTRRSSSSAAAAGLASGLAYLTRPEGVGLACILVMIVGLEWLRGNWRGAQALRVAAGVAIAAALCVVPYVVALQQYSGAWELTHKKSVSQFTGAAPRAADVAAPPPMPPSARAPSPLHAAIPPALAAARAVIDRGDDGLAVERAGSRAERAFASARMLSRTTSSAFRYGALLLLVAGLVAARGRPSQRALFVAGIAAAYAILLYVLTFSMGYVSRRHVLPPLLPLFGYVGLGALALGSGIANLARRRGSAWPGRASPLGIGVSIAVLVAAGELGDAARAASRRGPRCPRCGRVAARPSTLRATRDDPAAPRLLRGNALRSARSRRSHVDRVATRRVPRRNRGPLRVAR